MKAEKSTSETRTMEIAATLARQAKPGDVFALSGDLGAGKSVFARGFIQALCGADMDIPSPTFTLVQLYDSPRGMVYHFDLYRLEDPEEVLALDWDEAMARGICLVEWPEKSGTLLKGQHYTIDIKIENDTDRLIEIRDRLQK